MTKTGIKLITLDLDETLWPLQPTIGDAETALMDWLAGQAPALIEAHDLDSMREHRRALKQERPEIAHDVTELRRLSLELLLGDHGETPARASELAAEAMRRFLIFRNRTRPYPDTLNALRRLAARFRLVSVTNGNADPERTPLAGFFEHRVSAGMARASKPDPAVFELVLALTGCTAAEALHVGDEPLLDVQAARDAGMSAVWVNRTGRDWPESLQPPEREIQDLAELVDWLGLSTGTQVERREWTSS